MSYGQERVDTSKKPQNQRGKMELNLEQYDSAVEKSHVCMMFRSR